AKPEKPDDLKKVEGIGPKIEGLLNDDGLWTWEALATAPVERLQKILDAAGPRYRIHDPGTWPKQARLAADGDWDALETLQDHLKGGRES
ncbi:MAG: 50S ribosomal protein L27, partial [Acidobacteriota bacterium]